MCTAVCSQVCQNGGNCVSPNTCQCSSGWSGPSCSTRKLSLQMHLASDCPEQDLVDAAVCSSGCQNSGKCISPSTCDCTAGWHGSQCQTGKEPANKLFCCRNCHVLYFHVACKQGLYGPNCATTCSCQNGASCDRFTGTCTCTVGWIGTDCNMQCHQGKYGLGCSQTCNCYNSAACNHISGACSCTAGYIGTT